MKRGHPVIRVLQSQRHCRAHHTIRADATDYAHKPRCVWYSTVSLFTVDISRSRWYHVHEALTNLLCCRQALRCGTVSGVGIVLPVGGSMSATGISSLCPAGAVGNFGAGPALAFAML